MSMCFVCENKPCCPRFPYTPSFGPAGHCVIRFVSCIPAVNYERTTDNCGCFSFQNCIFQINSQKPLAKKRIQFLFSEKLGFLALHEKEYCPVSFLGIKKDGKITHMPDVIQLLIQKYYYADGKNGQAAWSRRGVKFSPVIFAPKRVKLSKVIDSQRKMRPSLS